MPERRTRAEGRFRPPAFTCSGGVDSALGPSDSRARRGAARGGAGGEGERTSRRRSGREVGPAGGSGWLPFPVFSAWRTGEMEVTHHGPGETSQRLSLPAGVPERGGNLPSG